jgi:tetratricopeptide (TPR) repeat protein
VAQQRYFTFAREQLVAAGGGETCAAVALYALGKSAPQVQPVSAGGSLGATGEQVACYQAALSTDEKNYLAANELGVVLADHGQLELARELFERSLAVSPQAATYHNLAVSLARLGDTAAAVRAAQRADEMRMARHDSLTGDNVRWVDAETFAKNSSPSDDGFPSAAAQPAPTQSATPQPAASQSSTAKSAPKKRMALFPWKNTTQR